jgi:hypothetical protein
MGTHMQQYGNMGSMKTTVEIADSLLAEAKSFADTAGVSLRQVIEEGLRKVIESRPPAAQFTLRDGSFRGKGLRADLSWPEIRRTIYQGRGE